MQKNIIFLFIIYLLTLGWESRAENTLSLEQVLATTLDTHPDLRGSSAQIDAAKSMERSRGYLQDPKLSLSWMGMDGPFKNSQGNSTKPSWSISQRFPFPTTWWQMQNSLKKQTESAKQRDDWKRAELKYQASQAFWDYVLAIRKLELLDDEESILKRHKKNTSLRPVTNELVRAHLYEIEEDISMLQNKRSEQKAMVTSALAMLSGFTGVAYSPESWPTPQYSSEVSPVLTKNDLNQDLRLQSLRAERLSQEAKVSEAKSKFAPDMMLSFKSYSEDTPMPGGKEFMVGVSIPFVYFWQTSAEVSSENAKLKVFEAREEALKRALTAQYKEAVSMASSSLEQYTRLRKEIIPQASKRLKFLENLSATDMETLMQRYMAGKKLIQYRTNEIEDFVGYKRLTAWVQSFGNSLNTQKGLN